ncbi:hypothetical protein QLX08_007350 [Tetragonisca angustula]
MRDSFKRSVTLLLCCCLLHLSESEDSVNGKTKASRAQSAKVFGKYPSGGLISFNPGHELLRIDWDVSIPFISIPLEYKVGENGEVPALFNINTKSLGIVGLIVSLLGVVSPLFSKTTMHPQYNYRSVDNGGVQWSQMGNTINEMMFNNDYVAPCMQRVVCSIVSVAAHSENPTSTDKIIDGLSSHSWFKGVTNGTIIEDAVTIGRKAGHDCARVYKDCLITPKLLKSMMSEFGIM